MAKTRNFGLDLLRAIAITLVVISHCTYLFVQESPNAVVLFIRTMGAVGVDLFFVLSGFLIGGLLLKEIDQNRTQFPHLITFWKRRWLRTLPNYFLILLINIFLYWIFSKKLPETIGSYFLFLQNFMGPHPEFFKEAWSLSIEEYAYLMLPFLIFFCFLFVKHRQHKLFLWVTLAVIMVLLILKIDFYYHAEVNAYKDWSAKFRRTLIYRLDAIYIGFVLVYLMRRFAGEIKRIKYVLFSSGVLLFLGVHFLMYWLQLSPQSDLAFFVFIYLSTITLSCALVFPWAVGLEHSKSFGRLIYFISTRSYAIYLINFSVVLLSFYHYFSSQLFLLDGIYKWGICLLYLLVTISLSNLIYSYFEKPILKYRDRITL